MRDDERRRDFNARADRARDDAEIEHAAHNSPHGVVFEGGFRFLVRREVDRVPASHASDLPNDWMIADRRFETGLQVLAVFERLRDQLLARFYVDDGVGG